MSDQEDSGGADTAKASQAAAMDALNLDDLFLGGDNDEEPLADSLFADMDIDLGDIMDGIIGEAGGNMSAVVSEEFGGGVAGRDGSSPDLDGPLSPMDAAADVGAAPSGGEYGGITDPSVAGGKGKVKSRTARSNPHLAMVQEQKEKESRIAKQLGLSGSDHSPSQILSPTAKRKRRKSKKFSADDDDDGVLSESAGMAAAEAYAAAAKKSGRRGGGVGHRGGHRAKITPNPLDGSTHSHSSTQSIQGVTASPPPPLPQQALQQELQSHQFQPAEIKEDAEQKEREAKERYERQQSLLRREQEAVSRFGLGPSRTLFFPYMALPAEVDVKKRGQKAYPCLERLNIHSDVRAPPQAGPPERSPPPPGDDGAPDDAAISASSPMYRLFEKHLGSLADGHPPESLRSSLAKSVRQASSLLKDGKKNDGKPKPSPALIDELSKLYTGCMKQSAFLRQNLWNTERWCADNLAKEDFEGAFDVRRRDVEWVLRMMQQMKQRRLEQQRQQKLRAAREALERERRRREERLRRERLELQARLKPKRILAPDVNCLPFPETMPEAPTHGGPHATPVIAIKVKVKISGWRDKSGVKLNARLWSPTGWKVALKRSSAVATAAAAAAATAAIAETNIGSAAPPDVMGGGATTTAAEGGAASVASVASSISNKSGQGGAAAPALDVSSVVSKATLEAVASELVRPDLMPRSSAPPKGTPPVAKAGPSATTASVARPSAPATVGSGVAVEEKKGERREEKKKAAARKRKLKEGGADVSSTAATCSSKAPAPGGRRSNKRQQFIPHVPSYDRPHHFRRHPAILAPSSAAGIRSKSTVAPLEKDESVFIDDPQQQRLRLLHFLHTQIFRPSISPTERRALLADEISSTLARLERARRSRETPKSLALEKQLEELRSVHREDTEQTEHAHGNTKGLWNWMRGNKYFDELETAEDVHDALRDCCPPELDERRWRLEEEDRGDCWGSLLPSPMPDKKKALVEGEGGVAAAGNSSAEEESSPLFDRLQSLLVEVDSGGSDDDDDEDDYLSDLPDFSPEEFIRGPNKIDHSPDDPALPDDAMMDVSALTLDQRTYVQLRAVGLVAKDAAPPPFPAPATTAKTPTNNESDESIDAVLRNMKSRLSALHAATNADAASLRRAALSHVARARRRQRCERADEAVMARYAQLQKARREEEEKQRQMVVRTSGRVKTGSNKFDGEQWLPW